MKRFVIGILLGAMICLGLSVALCRGAEERIVNLPQDSGKWYISVVGDMGAVGRINQQFNINVTLRSLKKQVHFNIVLKDTPIYKERYEPNTKALPMVRLQMPDGTVVYEACGQALPARDYDLADALAGALRKVNGDYYPVLPWRREHGCPGPYCPKPQPQPEPTPAPPFDQPPPDDGGAPVIDEPTPVNEEMSVGGVVGLLCGAWAAGALVGLAVWWKQKFYP